MESGWHALKKETPRSMARWQRAPRQILTMVGCLIVSLGALADEQPAVQDAKENIAARRMEVMKSRIDSIVVSSIDPRVPGKMHPTPLFRYDDETRGYVDGTVWRLGDTGRPLAIITAELHPRYLGGESSIVYDLLSLTTQPFTVKAQDWNWSPHASAVALLPLPKAPAPVETEPGRLAQMKQQARRFSGTQDVKELDTQFVHLRLLPREIDRYRPADHPRSDGAIFLLVNGRNPALVLLVETDGQAWQWGVGRLSLPSILELRLDDEVVWTGLRGVATPGYTATNRPASFP